MNHATFTKPAQQARAAALALTMTLGMLLSIDMLATQPAQDVQMAAKAASQAQVVSRTPRSPQG